MENQAVNPPMVLIVESDPVLLTEMAAKLDKNGYRCFLARSPEVAEEAVGAISFDLIIYSFRTDPLDAAESAAKLRRPSHMNDTPVFFLADSFEPKWIEPLHLAGGIYCLPRPFDSDKFLELVSKAVCLPHLATMKVSPPRPNFANDWVRLS